MDSVILKGIRFDLAVGLDAWRRVAKPQPVIVDLDIQPTFTLEAAAAKDDLSLTLDYGKPYKQLVKEANETLTYPDIRYLISHISDVVADYASLSLEISLPKALLQAKEGLAYHAMIDKSPDAGTVFTLSLTIKQIAAECIIGVNPHERTYKQPLFFDISVPIVAGSFEIVGEHDVGHHHQVHDLVQEVVERVEGSSYQTLEALATAVAQIVTMNYGYSLAKVRIEKPYAYPVIAATSVQLTRTKGFFENKDFWKVKLP